MDAKRVEERAKQLFRSNLYCAESVLKAVAEEAGVDSPLIPRIASGFCGGVARTGEICGAVTGGVMALSLMFGRDRAEDSITGVYGKVQQLQAEFKKECGSVNCSALIGCDLATDEGHRAFVERGLHKKCLQFTGLAARLAAQFSGEQ